MSYTNKTTHYELPQYIGTDIPSILTDLNDAYETIDESIYAVATQQTTDEATVTALAQTVSTLGTNVATNTANIASETTARQNADSALDTRVTTNANNVSALQTNMTTVTNRVSALETTMGSETLDTTAQTVTGAINELASGTASSEVQSGTLASGATSVTFTFTEQTIGSDTLIDVYTNTFGVNPTNVTYTASTVVLTFDAQDSAVGVAVKVEN